MSVASAASCLYSRPAARGLSQRNPLLSIHEACRRGPVPVLSIPLHQMQPPRCRSLAPGHRTRVYAKPEANRVHVMANPFSECGGPEGATLPLPSWHVHCHAQSWTDTCHLWHRGGAPKLLFLEQSVSRNSVSHLSHLSQSVRCFPSKVSKERIVQNHQMQSCSAFNPAPSPRAAWRPPPGLAPSVLGKQCSPLNAPPSSLRSSRLVDSNSSDSVD